jgi:hypothetical protein
MPPPQQHALDETAKTGVDDIRPITTLKSITSTIADGTEETPLFVATLSLTVSNKNNKVEKTTTGNTSKDDSIQGTAEGKNQVSIKVDKIFFQSEIKCLNSKWLLRYFFRVSLKLWAKVTKRYVLTYVIPSWN